MESRDQVIVIAEAGVNHNGDMNVAKKMIHVAADAGADFVKFQTFKSHLLATKGAPKAKYQDSNLGQSGQIYENQQTMLKALEISFEAHHELIAECQKCNIKFLSTAFDFESLAFLASLDLACWKIPSGELTNLPYLEIIAKQNKLTYLSTGMAELEEVAATQKVLLSSGLSPENLIIMHCTTDYPTKFTDVNLRSMLTIQSALNCAVGYSDHTLGIEVSIAAVALGAKVIEKHFTLDRKMPGPDHAASLEPAELKALVKSIRHISNALGSPIKRPTTIELENRVVARKSIIAKRAITAGEKLTTENVTTARPGSGISPMRWYDILGQVATKNYEPGDLV